MKNFIFCIVIFWADTSKIWSKRLKYTIIHRKTIRWSFSESFSKVQAFLSKIKNIKKRIMSLGAALTWKNFWTKSFLQTVFARWKPLLSPVFWQNMEKSFESFSRKFQIPHNWLIFPDFKIEIVLKHSFKSFLAPNCPLNLCKKSRKTLTLLMHNVPCPKMVRHM